MNFKKNKHFPQLLDLMRTTGDFSFKKWSDSANRCFRDESQSDVKDKMKSSLQSGPGVFTKNNF